MSNCSVRLFNPSDDEYAAVVGIYNALWPDERHWPVATWRLHDDEWPPTALNQRFVAECDRRISGMGVCYEKYWQHRPGTYHIEFHTHPDQQGRGIDKLLYETMVAFLQQLSPRPEIIATEAREDRPLRRQFLHERGFREHMRTSKSLLKVTEFDQAPYLNLFDRLEGQRIRIYTLAAMQQRDAEWKQKLYDLRWAIIQDVPAVEPPSRPTMAEFQTMILEDPALDTDAWFIAVDESEAGAPGSGSWVGMSNLWLNDPARKRLDTGLTGVRRAYRRRGIATAMKVRAIEFAQQLGAQTIETGNEENNPIVDLNLLLGFRPRAAWISYRKEFNAP